MNESLRSRVPRLPIRTLIAGGLAAGLAACGGGSGGSSSPVQTVPVPAVSPSATPATPAPGASPTAAPASTVTLSVPSISFNGVPQAASFTATSSTNSVLSATVDKPAVATVAPGSAAGQFTVSAVAAGTCTITVLDAKGGLSTLAVTVTTFPLTVN
jgi:hypothetical protein